MGVQVTKVELACFKCGVNVCVFFIFFQVSVSVDVSVSVNDVDCVY